MALPHHTRTLAHHSQYPSIALSLSLSTYSPPRLLLLLLLLLLPLLRLQLSPPRLRPSSLHPPSHHSASHLLHLARPALLASFRLAAPSALCNLGLAYHHELVLVLSTVVRAEERSRRKPVLPVTYHLSHTLPPPARPRPPRSYLSALELIYPRHTHTQAAATAIAAATATHYRYRYRYRYRYLTARPAAAARCRCSSTNSKPTTRIPPRCFCCQPFPPPPPSSSSPGTPFILPLLPATSR
ncbi:hypothetical protein BKA81DRAFT_91246 [Phyllosticta paracitricarpa]